MLLLKRVTCRCRRNARSLCNEVDISFWDIYTGSAGFRCLSLVGCSIVILESSYRNREIAILTPKSSTRGVPSDTALLRYQLDVVLWDSH